MTARTFEDLVHRVPDVGTHCFVHDIVYLFLLIENGADSRADLLDQLTDRTRGLSL